MEVRNDSSAARGWPASPGVLQMLASSALGGVLLFYLLVVATQATFRPRGTDCVRDAECGAGSFCDRDACVPVHGSGFTPASFGSSCAEAFDCSGGYLCVAGRCRSCSGDDECRADVDQAICATSALVQGARCEAPR